MLTISSQALGSPKHMQLIDDRVVWSNDYADSWVIGDSSAVRSVESLMETLSINLPHVIPEEFERSMDGIARGLIPWPLIIPQRVLGEHARSISSDVDEIGRAHV